jgi:flagella basal body P-ring formation protein FlgA
MHLRLLHLMGRMAGLASAVVLTAAASARTANAATWAAGGWQLDLVQTLQEQAPHAGARMEVEPVSLPVCQREVRLADVRGVRPGSAKVVLICDRPSWTRHVNVRIRTHVRGLVASKPLARGHVLTGDDMRMAEFELRADGLTPASQMEAVLGQELVRPIAAGAAVPLNALRIPAVIRKGDPITVVVSGAAFEVRTEGVATQDAGLGQIIAVKLRDGALVTGTVRQSGVVEVKL